MLFGRKNKEDKDNGPVLVASVMPAFSGMYSDLLEQNNIRFLCKPKGINGYLKIVTGGLLIPDDYYVNKEDYEKALEIFNAFIEPELEEE